MPNQFERPIDQQELWRDQITIRNVADFSGISLEELGERACQKIIQNVQDNPKREDYYRDKFNISQQDSIEDAIREKIATVSEEFMRKLPEKENKCQQQIDHCLSIAHERGYLQNEPEPITIIISHQLLHRGSPFRPYDNYLNSHDPTNNAIIIDIDLPATIIAHEFGHALSTNKKEGRSGVQTLTTGEKNKELITKGNKWLNEGLTVIWEQMTTLDTKDVPGRNEKGDLYNWYLEATKLILTEVNMSPDDALKAYFGDKKMLKLLQDKFQQRFHCSIEDLSHLGYKLDPDWTKKLVTGQPLTVTIKKTTNRSLSERLFKLAGIFPNLTIDEESPGTKH